MLEWNWRHTLAVVAFLGLAVFVIWAEGG